MQQEELIHKEKKQFSEHLFDVDKLHEEDLEEISSLIAQYPYCQPLRLIAVRSAINTDLYQKYLEEAAAIVPSRNVLYNIIHHPEKFKPQYQDEINTVEEQQEEPLISVIEDTSIDIGTEIAAQEEETAAPTEEVLKEEVYEEITPHEEPLLQVEEPELNITEVENLSLDGEHYSGAPVEEEVLNTIENNQPEEPISPIITEAPYIETLGDEEYQNLKATDNVSEARQREEGQSASLPMVKTADIFKYHEERLPYTFLWWLNKTRKEYQNIRPYATFHLDTSKAIKKQEEEVINHQIAENIFHLTSADELEKAGAPKTIAFDFMKREHQIIERFIKEEPQITPPQANKIDAENKAKKSSEDTNELVSETLAKVYVEQMLYHKALDIYKKLSLKYPEKNAYFASQIKYLELKVN